MRPGAAKPQLANINPVLNADGVAPLLLAGALYALGLEEAADFVLAEIDADEVRVARVVARGWTNGPWQVGTLLNESDKLSDGQLAERVRKDRLDAKLRSDPHREEPEG